VATFVRPLDRREAISLMQFAGLRLIGWDFWTFIRIGPSFQKAICPLDLRNTGSSGGLICWLGVAGPSFLPPPEMSDEGFDLG
jgi:hypothetical protein